MSEGTLTVEAPKGNYGNTGGNGGGTRDTSYQGRGITILKPGDVEDGPFGRVIINSQGNIVMNGVIMTEENSSMFNYTQKNGLPASVRVLNSMINNLPPNFKPGNNAGSLGQAIADNLAVKQANGWATAGLTSSAAINQSISEAINKMLPTQAMPATSTASYKAVRDALNSLPGRLLKNAIEQVQNAWERAYESTPDSIKKTKTTGGSNGTTVTTMVKNPVKDKLSESTSQVKRDLQDAVAKKTAQEKAAQETALKERQGAQNARTNTVQAASLSGTKIATPDARDAYNAAATQAAAKEQTSKTASALAKARRKDADTAAAAAVQADKKFNDLQSKVFGMDIYRGKYGSYKTTTTGGSNGTTRTTFTDSGVSTLDLDKARKGAWDARQAADKLEADAVTSENAANKATKESFDAETRKQATKASLDAATTTNDGNLLQTANEILTGLGKDISEHISGEYQKQWKSVANAVGNFQGKSIRSYNDAMRSLNALLANPSLVIDSGDRNAIVNAYRAYDAKKLSVKYFAISKVFKITDWAQKSQTIGEAIAKGFETGNWKPLGLEIEALALSTLTSAAVLGLLALLLSASTLSALTVSAITVAGIIVMGILSAYIDAKLVDSLNNKLAELTIHK